MNYIRTHLLAIYQLKGLDPAESDSLREWNRIERSGFSPQIHAWLLKVPFWGSQWPKTDILVLPEFTSVVFGGILQNQTIFDKDLGLVRWILSENYFLLTNIFFRLAHPIFTIPSILLQVK